MTAKTNKSEEEWKKELEPQQFYILRMKGTEPAFSGEYVDNKKKGHYKCAACGNTLFESDKKYDSRSGWPSFWAPASKQSVETKQDRSLFMTRTEVACSQCGGHLGHVFNDGPEPTGQRYCINSAALKFEDEKQKNEEKP
ncbi:MAG TPA: peptide-methionine (R)-S-oxide reductase MsrB [Thermoplasmata archaeon]